MEGWTKGFQMLWQRGKQDTHGLPSRQLLSSAKNNYKNSLQKLWQKSEASATNTHNILKPWARMNGSKQKTLVVWCSLSWSKEPNSSSHHSCRNTACGWTSGNRKGKWSARRVSDPEDHPWVEPLCWFKTCISGVIEKRLILSSHISMRSTTKMGTAHKTERSMPLVTCL